MPEVFDDARVAFSLVGADVIVRITFADATDAETAFDELVAEARLEGGDRVTVLPKGQVQ